MRRNAHLHGFGGLLEIRMEVFVALGTHRVGYVIARKGRKAQLGRSRRYDKTRVAGGRAGKQARTRE